MRASGCLPGVDPGILARLELVVMEGNLELLVLKRARQRLVGRGVDADRARHLGVAALAMILTVGLQ